MNKGSEFIHIEKVVFDDVDRSIELRTQRLPLQKPRTQIHQSKIMSSSWILYGCPRSHKGNMRNVRIEGQKNIRLPDVYADKQQLPNRK